MAVTDPSGCTVWVMFTAVSLKLGGVKPLKKYCAIYLIIVLDGSAATTIFVKKDRGT